MFFFFGYVLTLILYAINLLLIIYFPKILCENDDEVLVTLKEGKLFGEVSK